MKFGTIGAGTVALAFPRALATGHEVVLTGRRGPESLSGQVLNQVTIHLFVETMLFGGVGPAAWAITIENMASIYCPR